MRVTAGRRSQQPQEERYDCDDGQNAESEHRRYRATHPLLIAGRVEAVRKEGDDDGDDDPAGGGWCVFSFRFGVMAP